MEESRCHTKDPPLHRNVLFRFRQAQVLSRSKLVWFTLSRCGRHPRRDRSGYIYGRRLRLVLTQRLAAPAVDEVELRTRRAFDALMLVIGRIMGIIQPVLYTKPGCWTRKENWAGHTTSSTARCMSNCATSTERPIMFISLLRKRRYWKHRDRNHLRHINRLLLRQCEIGVRFRNSRR